MKSLASHALTVLVTLCIVAYWIHSLELAPAHREPRLPFQETRQPAEPAAAPVPVPPPEDAVLEKVDADEQVNIWVYQNDNRSVVNITTASGGGGIYGDEVNTGSGSGFVIDDAGRILTNYHVVADAEAIQVTMFDGTNYRARLIGSDINNDIAVIQVDTPADKIVPLLLGDSSGLRVGQKVLALGNPFGLERTLTTGIISSLERSIKSKNNRTIKGIIQTDAAINPGNSGGPLLNTRGQVIGMNTAILSSVGQSAGIGFAVPINSIKRILPSLIQTGRVVRADLGIRRVFTTEGGIYLIELDENGPAAKAGLQPMQVVVERLGRYLRKRPDPETADRILAINGKQVRTVDELLTEIESHQPGDSVSVTCVQNGRKRVVKVTLGATD